ncbi:MULTISPECIES: hypothetical protein [Mesonia]|uniref:Uncharacterized protein n=1 Tax=Mesonia oceanica TaxID=2687242 RepID=A0AC61Y6Z4_9FLAO|nr:MULTISPECIES: hypothetical protein [Mesonia]MAN26726.1 hypothetical protein [Mesonia sp.]MAQ40430.1 hypothetical protein [Mesonia sp.]MBJ98051.1 hypothetical protein [Flavobacteriaceae bacterium]VVV00267.1 hypothetical protein FVB9532_01533 [Mesonia oceanica]|tara:strand:+ start:726 stop:974 length:249 start_codon:yes stop_codon:yes gene_type:complete
MKARNLKSLEDATDRDLLKYVLASNRQILRRLECLESSFEKDKKRPPHYETTKRMIDGLDSSYDRINDYLKMDDIEKGILKM